MVVEKPRGLWGISQCWRGVVQQQVELGGLTGGVRNLPWVDGAGSGVWKCPGSMGRAQGCTWSPQGLERCGDSPAALASLAWLGCQPGPVPGLTRRQVQRRAVMSCWAAAVPPLCPHSPCPALGAALPPWQPHSSTRAPSWPWLRPRQLVLAGQGRAGDIPRGTSCCGLSPRAAPTGAAVPGGGGAGAGPCGALLPAVPAPARGHGGALWAAGCLRAGPGPGLCRGFAAALLPDCSARESRERDPAAVALGTGWGAALAHGIGASSGWVMSCSPEPQSPALAPRMMPSSGAWCSSQRGPGPGTLLPWAGAWAPSAPARERQSFPAAPRRDIAPARPCGHL